MAKLYFRYGAMNSGKSTLIIQTAYNYEERNQNVLLLKPTVDIKDPAVLSRIGARRAVDIHIDSSMDVYKEIAELLQHQPIHCILVDEVQFLSPLQIEQLLLIVVRLDIPVMGFGLRTDFQTKGFPGATRLLELAHSVEEMKTICRCGVKAIFNGRKINGKFVSQGDQVAIDGHAVEYESLCARCYDTEIGLTM